MPHFSMSSLSKLNTCHEDLQLIFKHVIELTDCTVLVGHRGEAEQDQAFDEKKSKLRFPNSKHNSSPSMAADVAPYPIPDWKKTVDFIYFGGFVMGVAELLYEQGMVRHKVRYGGDWNKNDRVSDERFFDCVHFELYLP